MVTPQLEIPVPEKLQQQGVKAPLLDLIQTLHPPVQVLHPLLQALLLQEGLLQVADLHIEGKLYNKKR